MLSKFSIKLILFLSVVFIFSSCTKNRDNDEKVLYLSVAAKIKGLDPINTGDTYSSNEASRVYEGLLKYHYLKRPYELIPNLAAEMPKVSDDGLTYTFKIRKGVLFHDNKCFPNGKGRELKASDFVYSIQRLADAKNVSVGWWLLDDKIIGLNEWRDRNKDLEKTNYDDLDIDGLKAIDDYTLQFKLKKPFPQFLYSLAMSYTYAVPKEAVDFYGQELVNNPVGTGPYITPTFTSTNKITYTANPTYREMLYPSEGEPGDKEKGLLDAAGKKLPLVKKIVVNILPESQTRWLNFKKGKIDFNGIPKDDFQSAVTPDKGVTEEFKKKGMELEITPDLDITYTVFNHDDPLFAKNPDLKRAMSLAYDTAKANTLFFNDTAILAQTPIPPGIGGYDPKYKNPYMRYDLEEAKKLLAKAGYPGGKGLPVIKYNTLSKTDSKQQAEFFKKQMALIGVKIKIETSTWPQLVSLVKGRKAQMYGMAWLGDYPDAENFLQLIYGPNQSPGPNGANFDNKDFNKRFEKYTKMQPGSERAKLYAKLAQEYSEQVPWILGVHRTSYVMKHSWLKNYKFSTFNYGNSQYWDIDLKQKQKVIDTL